MGGHGPFISAMLGISPGHSGGGPSAEACEVGFVSSITEPVADVCSWVCSSVS